MPILNVVDDIKVNGNTVDKIYKGNTFIYGRNRIYDPKLSSLDNWALLRPENISIDNTYGTAGHNSILIRATGQTSLIYSRFGTTAAQYEPCAAGQKWGLSIDYYIRDYTLIDAPANMLFRQLAANKSTVIKDLFVNSLNVYTATNGYGKLSTEVTILPNAAYIQVLFELNKNGEVWYFRPRLYRIS